jgi:hypothetical protein
MPDEHSLTSRRADRLRTHFAGVESGLEVIVERVAWLATPEGDVARLFDGDGGRIGGSDRIGSGLLLDGGVLAVVCPRLDPTYRLARMEKPSGSTYMIAGESRFMSRPWP